MVHRGVLRPGIHGHLSHRQIRLEMDAEGAVRPLQGPDLDKEDRPRAVLLTWLKDQGDLPGKIVLQLFQGPGGPKEGGGVGVVAAGVHHAGALGGVGHGFLVLDGQGVGVRPEDDLPPRPPFAPDGPQHPGRPHPEGGDADGVQLLLNALGSLKFLHAQLRVAVKPAAQGDDVVLVLFNQRMDGHIDSPQSYVCSRPPRGRELYLA